MRPGLVLNGTHERLQRVPNHLSVILAFLTSLRGQQDGGGAKKVSLQVGLDLLMSGSRDSLRIHTGKRISVSGEWFGRNRRGAGTYLVCKHAPAPLSRRPAVRADTLCRHGAPA
jgi:hypothetical protein